MAEKKNVYFSYDKLEQAGQEDIRACDYGEQEKACTLIFGSHQRMSWPMTAKTHGIQLKSFSPKRMPGDSGLVAVPGHLLTVPVCCA